MRKSVWVLAGLGFASLVLQTSLVPMIQVMGLRPDLILVSGLLTGLAAGPGAGLAFGSIMGFLVDLLNGRLLGLFAAANGAAVLLVALVGQKIYKENILVPVLAGTFGTLIHGLVIAILLKVSGVAPGLQVTVFTARTMVLEAALNGVLTAAFFGAANRLRARLQAGAAVDDARRPAFWS